MPISEAEKKVLLERLELARVAKQKKAEEAKAAKSMKKAPEPAPAPAPVTAPPVVIPAPAPAPAPVPEERPPVSEPIDIPEVPDLVTASRKPAKGKKVVLPDSDSDSDSEVAMPKKKKKAVAKKDTPFLKIKLYKEPQDKQAFNNLLQAVAGEVEEEEEEEVEAPPPPPPQKPYHKGPHVFHRVGATPRGAVSKSLTKEEIEATELRRLALQIFG
jgi:hypothetical protein